MNFGDAIKSVFNNYATFSGRARRSEYWYFYLFNLLVSMGIGLIPIINLFGGLWALAVLIPTLAVTVRRFHDIGKSGWWFLVMMIPGILFFGVFLYFCVKLALDAQAMGIDIENLEDYETILDLMRAQSTSLILMGVLLIVSMAVFVWQIVWLVTDSEPGENQYGPNPKEVASSAPFSANGNITNDDFNV